jgi:carbamate kinase
MAANKPAHSERLVVALGGNGIYSGNIRETLAQQRGIAEQTEQTLLPLMQMNNRLIITHGNGPVVGKTLMRQALSRERVALMSLDICVAHSQGGIVYLLMGALENTLRRAGNLCHVVCLLTQVEVDPDDPAFSILTKPIAYGFRPSNYL